MTTTHRSLVRIAAALVLVAAAMPATTEAQTIEACYSKGSGTLYRVGQPNTPADCSSKHVKETWNVQGPKGDQGPAGFVGISQTQAFIYVQGNTQLQTFGFSCPTGQVMIGMGFNSDANPGVRVRALYPSVNGTSAPNQWKISVENTSSTLAEVLLYRLCLQLN